MNAQSAPIAVVTAPARTKVPMHEAVAMLAEACRQVDEGADPTGVVAEMFREARLDIADAIDRRKAFKAVCEAQADAAKKAADELRAYAARLGTMVEALKANTQAIMEAEPSLPYRDSVGRKLSLVQSPARLVLDVDLRERKTVSNIIDTATIDLIGISPEYVGVAQFLVLDVEKIKADLAVGTEISWARLERGQHVRGL